VTFDVIPAIDVTRGRLARPTARGVQVVDAFEGDPLRAARSFFEVGARWIHVVDLDLVEAGRFVNLEVVEQVATLGALVQASGGITTVAHAEAARSAGAARVVLSSAALADRPAVEDLIGRFGDRVVIGLETDGDRIAPRGRGDDLPLLPTLEWLAGINVPRYVHTNVARVGALDGPDLASVHALVERTRRPVIAAGGIRGIEDLREVTASGAEGAIVGRALYEGFDFRAALNLS
jgi:phosphoribosylformimino-5-aminoimidazole carboxamide ribonucleotide (ProFAR) isomerase